MAIIPLRAYNREIEELIDNSQLEEAVAHCRHILATYPKHIATYRLLGKAHLEQQRISDATDIFQRVLSVVPDDFVANVGMSIIREDENNLDAAIWHMELAYEAQPSNNAIQDELLRLYSRRDGVQPPKVRLTRGALARMYAKGGLFDQAIAELRAAIAEDPNRSDLQLLLAQMYFQTSQRVEAVDTCANILKKLPYCLVANQILAASLPGADRSDVGKGYRQAAITMDPYFAFADPEAISSDQVPDNAITIEKLEWKSGLQINAAAPQPTWATSLGISLEKPPDETVPDWVQNQEASTPAESVEQPQSNVSPFIWDTQEVKNIITDASKPEAEIPDWMRDAGWKPATGEAAERPSGPIGELFNAPEPPEEPAEKAEIPDWLRGIAPEGVLDEKTETPPEAKDTSIPWLDKQQPGPTDSIIQWLEEKKPEVPVSPPAPETASLDLTDEEVPEWLRDLDVPVPGSSEQKPAGESPAFVMGTPAFIEEPEISEPSEVIEENAPLPYETRVPPDITATGPAETELPVVPEAAEPQESAVAPTEEIPDWLRELAAEMPIVAPADQIVENEVIEETPLTFEEEVAEAQPAILEETPVTETPASGTEGAGEDLRSMLEEMAAGLPPILTTSEELAEQQVTMEEVPEQETPVEQPVGSEEAQVLQAQVEQLAPTEERPEFETKLEQPAVTEEAPIAEGTEQLVGAEELPIEETAPIEEPIQFEQPAAAKGEPPVETPSISGEAEAFAWLEGLAAKQGASEEELITPLEEREETVPDWVTKEASAELEKLITQPESAEPESGEELPPAVPAEVIPDWIKGLGETPEEEISAELPAAPISELEVAKAEPEIAGPEPEAIAPSPEAPVPELSVSQAEPPAPEPELAAPEPQVEVAPEEELPDWLLEMAQPEEEKEALGAVPEGLEWREEELPAWLKELTEEEAVGEGLPPSKAKVEVEGGVVSEELVSEWTPEEVQAVEVSEEIKEPEQEPRAEEGAWIPETETQVQPVPTEEVIAEVVAAAAPIEMEPTEPEIAAPPPAEVPAEAAVEAPDALHEVLEQAWNAINQDQPAQAAGLYSSLIKQNYHLEEMITDLQDALYRFPLDIDLWVSLGDAQFRHGNSQEALNAYTKAEELVR